MTDDNPGLSSMSGSLYVTSVNLQTIQLAPPPIVTITGANYRPLVTIHPDGRVELGEDYQPDEPAQAFWAAVQRLVPSPMVQQFGAPLTARINTELARGQRAEDLLRATLRVYEAVHSDRVDGHRFGPLQDCAMCEHAGQVRALLSEPAPRPI